MILRTPANRVNSLAKFIFKLPVLWELLFLQDALKLIQTRLKSNLNPANLKTIYSYLGQTAVVSRTINCGVGITACCLLPANKLNIDLAANCPSS